MDRRPPAARAPRAAAAAPPAGWNSGGKAADEPVPALEEWEVPAVFGKLREKDWGAPEEVSRGRPRPERLGRTEEKDSLHHAHPHPPPEASEELKSPQRWSAPTQSRCLDRKATEIVLRRGSTKESLDSTAPWWQSTKVRKFVHGQYFESVMGVIILVNCVLIGVEVQLKLDNKDVVVISWLDSIFLVWFMFEALLRFLADGKVVFKSSWFRFDVALVVSGIVISWILMPIVTAMGVQQVPLVSQLLTLRVLRLLRTVRAFRMMSAFSELCRLCSGLLRSLRTMLSVGLLVFVSLFSFAVLGVDLITHSENLNKNDETRMIVESRFATLPGFMVTLMQFATADGLSSIYYPLCQEEPLLLLYFCGLWMVITVALMNLVTAVIVDSALSLGREEAELKQAINRKTLQKNIDNLEALFEFIDADDSGTISFEEMHGLYNVGQLVFPKDITSMIDPEHLVDMFEFVDKDKSGEIDKEEFIEGVCCLALSSMSIESLQMLQLLRGCHQMLIDFQAPSSGFGAKRNATGLVRGFTSNIT